MYNSSSIASFYCWLYIRLKMASLYIFSLQILLNALKIDIANFYVVIIIGGYSVGGCSINGYSVLLSTLFLSTAWLILGLLVKMTFLGLCQGLSSLTGAFYFFVLMAGVLISHCINNLALCLVSSIYGLLAIITCLIYRAQMRKCFVVSGL